MSLVNVQEYSYRLVMADSLIVSQQLSIVVLFVAVFMHTLGGTINGNQMGALDIMIALGGYIVWAVCRTFPFFTFFMVLVSKRHVNMIH